MGRISRGHPGVIRADIPAQNFGQGRQNPGKQAFWRGGAFPQVTALPSPPPPPLPLALLAMLRRGWPRLVWGRDPRAQGGGEGGPSKRHLGPTPHLGVLGCSICFREIASTPLDPPQGPPRGTWGQTHIIVTCGGPQQHCCQKCYLLSCTTALKKMISE